MLLFTPLSCLSGCIFCFSFLFFVLLILRFTFLISFIQFGFYGIRRAEKALSAYKYFIPLTIKKNVNNYLRKMIVLIFAYWFRHAASVVICCAHAAWRNCWSFRAPTRLSVSQPCKNLLNAFHTCKVLPHILLYLCLRARVVNFLLLFAPRRPLRL